MIITALTAAWLWSIKLRTGFSALMTQQLENSLCVEIAVKCKMDILFESDEEHAAKRQEWAPPAQDIGVP